MNNSLKRRPLQKQLQLIVMLCLSLCLVGTALLFQVSEYQFSKKSLVQEFTSFGDLIGNRSIAALIFADKDAARNNLESAKYTSDVISICLYDNQKSLFSQYHRQGKSNCTKTIDNLLRHGEHHFAKDTIELSLVIKDDYKNIGYLIINGSLASITEHLKSTLATLLTAFIVSLFVSYFASRRLLTKALAPLDKLHKSTKRLSKDPFTYKKDNALTPVNNDEVGDLVISYNSMIETIQKEHEKLQVSVKQFSKLAENSPIGIYLKNTKQEITYANRKWNQITQCRTNSDEQTFIGRIHEDDIENYKRKVDYVISSGQSSIIEYRLLLDDDSDTKILMEYLSPLEENSSPENSPESNGVIGSVLDISDLKTAQSELERLAFYDPLTDLPNRRFFKDHLKFRIALAKKERTRLSVLMIDLDNFKRVNDSLGHDAGDQLLTEVGQRMRSAVFQEDVVSRVGGDEFIILLEHTQKDFTIEQVAQKLLNVTTLPLTIQNQKIEVSCSIGIARYPEDADNIPDLIRHADMALYQAKARGKNQLAFFSKELNERLLDNMRLERKLRQALLSERLEIYIQPQYNHLKKCLFWGETLLRWNDPEEGFISPARFIPIAEESDLIIDIGLWVMRQVCILLNEQGEALKRVGIKGIAINLSARQFYSKDLIQQLKMMLKEYNVDPTCLEMELTESMVMEDVEVAVDTMRQLRQLGCRLSIDDFGTGYSSLAYLKRFQIDSLKIDKSFVDGLPSDYNDAAITTAIIAMASKLGLSVIAEGIENKAQSDFLSTNGCPLMQGYFYAKPMPIHQLLELPVVAP